MPTAIFSSGGSFRSLSPHLDGTFTTEDRPVSYTIKNDYSIVFVTLSYWTTGAIKAPSYSGTGTVVNLPEGESSYSTFDGDYQHSLMIFDVKKNDTISVNTANGQGRIILRVIGFK